MTDDIKKRLQDSAETCVKNYEAWDKEKKNSELRENLQESIHELRKVASRLEIEIAVSERDNLSGKPIPIPPHRSSSKDKGAVESILPDNGNTHGNGEKKQNGGARRQRTRRPAAKKAD